MNPILLALLQSWDWRLDVILILLLAGILYTRGWTRLRKNRRGSRKETPGLAAGWRLGSYLGGLLVLGLALLSPIDVLGGQLFYMHMIQHLLLVMLAPPLLLIANPLPFVLWGMPDALRLRTGQLLRRDAGFRQSIRTLTPPGWVWMIFIAVFLGWHDPNAYNAALQWAWVHDLEHITFFGTALLFWWHVTGAGPRIHKRLPAGLQIAFVLITVPINMLAGIGITFSREPIYTYYTHVPRLWGLSVMEDQMLGGSIMWIAGSMMYLIAALVLIARYVQVDDKKKPRMIVRSAAVIGVLALLSGTPTINALAHGGGIPQLTEAPAGPYMVSAWTQPNPGVGDLHVSVAVTQPGNGAPVLAAFITVRVEPLDAAFEPIVSDATHGASINKLLYEADLHIPHDGRWRVSILVEGPTGNGETSFELEILPPASKATLYFGLGVAIFVAGWSIPRLAKRK